MSSKTVGKTQVAPLLHRRARLKHDEREKTVISIPRHMIVGKLRVLQYILTVYSHLNFVIVTLKIDVKSHLFPTTEITNSGRP